MSKIPQSEGPAPIRVGVADKSPLIRAALQHLLSEDDRFELVDVVIDGEQFLDLIDRQRIDVAVIGWIIAPGDGKFILDQLRSHEAAPRIIVYTGAPSATIAPQVMAHGGAAFVSKSEQPDFLIDTVAAVAAGRMLFPFLDVRAINQNPLTTLTRRELEVLSLLAAGQSNKQIAESQAVSPNTVKFHIRNLFQKLDVHSRSQAIALYLNS
jgi:two-component system, NarL family, nitrate/nitrite response regulator NarL